MLKKRNRSCKSKLSLTRCHFQPSTLLGRTISVYYKDGMPYMLDENKLPLELPEVDKFLPTEKGEPPLAAPKVGKLMVSHWN